MTGTQTSCPVTYTHSCTFRFPTDLENSSRWTLHMFVSSKNTLQRHIYDFRYFISHLNTQTVTLFNTAVMSSNILRRDRTISHSYGLMDCSTGFTVPAAFMILSGLNQGIPCPALRHFWARDHPTRYLACVSVLLNL